MAEIISMSVESTANALGDGDAGLASQEFRGFSRAGRAPQSSGSALTSSDHDGGSADVRAVFLGSVHR